MHYIAKQEQIYVRNINIWKNGNFRNHGSNAELYYISLHMVLNVLFIFFNFSYTTDVFE